MMLIALYFEYLCIYLFMLMRSSKQSKLAYKLLSQSQGCIHMLWWSNQISLPTWTLLIDTSVVLLWSCYWGWYWQIIIVFNLFFQCITVLPWHRNIYLRQYKWLTWYLLFWRNTASLLPDRFFTLLVRFYGVRGGSKIIWIAPSGGRDRPDPVTKEWYPVRAFLYIQFTLFLFNI